MIAAHVLNILIILMTFIGIAALHAADAKDPHISLEAPGDSHACLNCHDELIAEHPMNHPIQVNYLEAQINRPSAVLKPITSLPSYIKLIEGQVECITCHNMESTLPFKLQMTMERSALCFACHDR